MVYKCDYCGNKYQIKMDECPTCGARSMTKLPDEFEPHPQPDLYYKKELLEPCHTADYGPNIPNTSPYWQQYEMVTETPTGLTLISPMILFIIGVVGAIGIVLGKIFGII